MPLRCRRSVNALAGKGRSRQGGGKYAMETAIEKPDKKGSYAVRGTAMHNAATSVGSRTGNGQETEQTKQPP